jgi:Carboxypeptidase regulatory-like domain
MATHLTFSRISSFLLILLANAQAQPHPSGVIRGTVVDEAGNPVAGATVWAVRFDVPVHGFQPEFQTGADGRFTIGHLSYGKYNVLAKKESDGYADVHWGVYDYSVPTAEIFASAPVADVRVRIGPKAATVSGSITDAVSGAKLETVTLRIWQWTGQHNTESNSLSASSVANPPGTYRILVPPGKEVGLEISAPGYKPWTYSGEFGGTEPFPLNLASGAAKVINVQLQPEPK